MRGVLLEYTMGLPQDGRLLIIQSFNFSAGPEKSYRLAHCLLSKLAGDIVDQRPDMVDADVSPRLPRDLGVSAWTA